MARHPRLVVPGIALHVRQRGNNRQDCFYQDNDRLVYLAILRDLLALRRCALHAYCLMTNHVHLLLTPQDDMGCSLLLRDVARCYASYFNRRYARSGQLWEGRFRSCLVDSARYVLGCYRYIEFNPVAAGMVQTPRHYPWSSHGSNIGTRVESMLAPHEEYLALGMDEAARLRAYRELTATGDDPELRSAMRKATENGFPLVGDRLRTRLQTEGARVQRERPGPMDRSPSVEGGSPGQLDLLTE